MNPSLENPFRSTSKRATKRLFKADELQKNNTTKATKEKIDSKLENALVKYGPHKILYPQVQFLKKLEDCIPKENLWQKNGITPYQRIAESIKVEKGNVVSLIVGFLGLTSVPPEIGNLTKLRIFYCYNNNLKKIPAEIGRLSDLLEFFCSSNQISKLPAEIGQLTNLQSLVCRYNNLSVLPLEISQLINLQKFVCADNNLSKQEKARIKKIFPFAEV